MPAAGRPICNARQKMDGLALLRSLADRCAAAVFFDAQYRTGLDKLKFGNEGSRQKARYLLPQMSDAQIRKFVAESIRVLKPSAHLFLWLDKYALFEGSWHRWLPEIMPARLVDGFVWDKVALGMGRRSRYRLEALAVIQRAPIRAAGVWTDHKLEDLWTEKPDRQRHPHAKPVGLVKRLILATTRRGDYVVDPAAGAYGTLEACLATGRNFIGCDLEG